MAPVTQRAARMPETWAILSVPAWLAARLRGWGFLRRDLGVAGCEYAHHCNLPIVMMLTA
jgi:hypothetical protein